VYFKNRIHAGKVLANAIVDEWRNKRPVVVAVSSGGIPVAYSISKKLNAMLDTIVIKRIGIQQNPKYSIGSIGEDLHIWLNENQIKALRLNQKEVDQLIAKSMKDVFRLSKAIRKTIEKIDIKGRPIILVDDGISSGATMMVAIKILKSRGASSIDVIVPVSSIEGFELVKNEANFVFSAHKPYIFGSIGEWFENYQPVNQIRAAHLLKNNNHILNEISSKT